MDRLVETGIRDIDWRGRYLARWADAPGWVDPIPTTSGLAIASLVLSLVWLGGLGSLLAVILGFVALSQIAYGRRKGRGLAIAGVTIGFIGIIGLVVLIAIPIVLDVQAAQNYRAAQTNLTNALIEANADYQTEGQSFKSAVVGTFQSSAPQFKWTTDACRATSAPNCISYAVADAASAGDAQVLILAKWTRNGTCWYLADAEQGLMPFTDVNPDRAAVNAGISEAALGNQYGVGGGVLYAKSTQSASSCAATDPANSENGFSGPTSTWYQTWAAVTQPG